MKELDIDKGITENLKKATMEMLVLEFLDRGETHINAIIDSIKRCSNGRITIVFPYSALYRLYDKEYIEQSGKK